MSRTHTTLLLFSLSAFLSVPGIAAAQECTDVVRAPCAELRKTFDANCASSMPDQGRSPEWWFERVVAFAPAYTQLMSQKATLDQCAACNEVYAPWERTCTERRASIAEEWSDFIATSAEESFQFQSYLKNAADNQRYPQALHSMDERITQLESVRTIGTDLAFEADLSALDQRISALRAQREDLERRYHKLIAGVRCPTKGRANARHLATVSAFFEKDPAYLKHVHLLRVTGKSGKRYDRSRHTTYETLPLSVCVEDPTPEGGPRCYVWQMSVQRSRVDGDTWSGWDTVLVGSQKEMLCKNLKRRK